MTKGESARPGRLLAALAVALMTVLALLGPGSGSAKADESTGVLRGVLLTVTGETVANAGVEVFREWEDDPFASTTTDASGAWSLDLPLGSYQIAFTSKGQTQWAFSRTTRAQSDLYPVMPGDLTVVNNKLIDAAHVRGTVTTWTGYGLAGACVRLLSAANPREVVASGCADAKGRYDLTAGEEIPVVVEVTDPSGAFAGGYVGSATFANATRFTLRRGASVTANASLSQSSRLSGKVVAADGRPVAGACPTVFIERTSQVVVGARPACSGADGVWSVTGVPVGAFTVQLSSAEGAFTTRWVGGTTQAAAQLVRINRPGSARSAPTEKIGGKTGTAVAPLPSASTTSSNAEASQLPRAARARQLTAGHRA